MRANSTTLPPFFRRLVMFFLLTAYVLLRDNTGKEEQLCALLDSGSQTSFITEAEAKSNIPPLENIQTPIAAFGSSRTPRTQDLIVSKFNDAVETNLNVILKITNEKPTQTIDVTKLRHNKNLHNRIKHNGVVVRQSTIGLIVSGRVQGTEIQNENPSFANLLSVVSSNHTEVLISKFRELESLPSKQHLCHAKKDCESHYDLTTEQKPNIRFAV